MVISQEQWEDKAAKLNYPNQCWINGSSIAAINGATFDSINPATGKVLAKVAAGSEVEIDLAVSAARQAFNSGVWAHTAPSERKATLLRLADLIEENTEELALLESLDMGKPIRDSLTIDVPGAAAILRWHAEAIDKLYDEVAPTGRGNLAMVRREPLGVVGAVVPWNFPLDMAIWKCAPALAVGNSVVLKPAEQSSFTAIRLAQLASEAGLPNGVLNVVTGLGHEAGKALGLHMDVDCVAFTGSTEVGKYFLQYSGQSNMKQIWLECGGKSPNLIFANCKNLDAAAAASAFGIFFNQGEVCSANSRVLVEESIKDEFMALLKEHAANWQPGYPLNPEVSAGALVTSEHANRVMDFVEKGIAQGELYCGGKRLNINGSSCYLEPTIIEVQPNHVIAKEEIFGPVASVMSFSEESEAIEMANNSIYGLAASVWTDDLSQALRVSDALVAGTVSVNACDKLSPMTPFGGFKQSGNGRDLSLHSFDKYSGLKTCWIEY